MASRHALNPVTLALIKPGDKHYWPKPEDAPFFCKPGRDVDVKLKELGAKPIVALGIGDDADSDGYNTGP